jgi:predicted MFS family arabinose efflux permease
VSELAGATSASTEFSERTRHYVLGVLVVVYTMNFIDRQILSILLEPIKHDLGLSDTQLGLLTGFAFGVFYATLGVPIARLADRSNRRNLIAVALTVWSGMTAFSGLAQNYVQLLLARIGVGVGEAGCSPSAHSMISDYFAGERRATALGIYSLGIPVGILFGFTLGGLISDTFGWRAAFFVVGVPGLLLALLLRFTVREPPRGLAEGRVATGEQPSIVTTVRLLWSRPSFRHLAIGGALTAFVGYGWVNWTPSFLARSYQLSQSEAGTALGLIFGIPGGIGIALGGWLADRLGSSDPRWYLRMVAVALAAAVPFTAGVFLSTSATMALAFMTIPVTLGNFYQATTFSQTQGLVGLRMRAVAAAFLLFVLNIVGLGAGPYAVGLLSDLLAERYAQESVRMSLFYLSFVNLWAAYHYWRGGRYLAADLARARVEG